MGSGKRHRARDRLTFANVIALVALFAALGGGAYAGAKLSKNSVKSKQIKNGSIAGRDLGADSVDSSKIKDGSLQSGDFANGQLPEGPPGQAGPQGPPGQDGAPGQNAASAYAWIKEPSSGGPLVAYGRGVSGVSFSASSYSLTFANSIESCAISVTQGTGTTSTSSQSNIGYPSVSVTGTNTALVTWFRPSAEGSSGFQTSFFVAALC